MTLVMSLCAHWCTTLDATRISFLTWGCTENPGKAAEPHDRGRPTLLRSTYKQSGDITQAARHAAEIRDHASGVHVSPTN